MPYAFNMHSVPFSAPLIGRAAPLPKMFALDENEYEENYCYWKERLEELPLPPSLQNYNPPNHFHILNYVFELTDDELMRRIKRRVGDNRGKIVNLLLVVWFFFLQRENDSSDVYCPVIFPDEYKSPAADKNVAARLTALVMRFCPDENELVSYAALDFWEETKEAKEYMFPKMRYIFESLGVTASDFFYLVSFHDFWQPTEEYNDVLAQKKATCLSTDTWDSRDMDLGLYFREAEGNIKIVFRYNEEAFTYRQIANIGRDFRFMLEIMLSAWQDTVANYKNRCDAQMGTRNRLTGLKAQRAERFFYDFYLFRQIPRMELKKMVTAAKIFTCSVPGDLPPADGDLLLFLQWGEMERFMVLPEGAPKSIDVTQEKIILNEPVLLKDCKEKISLKIVNSPVIIIALPLKKLAAYPNVKRLLTAYAAQKINEYMAKIYFGENAAS